MTRARTPANEVGSPSRSQLWLTALLRALVELVLNVVSTFHMKRNRMSRDWRTGPAHTSLPRAKSDAEQQETHLAVRQGSSLPYPRDDLPSRKRAALSGAHVPTCGLADEWFPALRDCVAPAGMTISGSGAQVCAPRKSGDPGTASTLVLDFGRGRMATHALPSALDPRFRGECGREGLSKDTART
jgi:hypothetical protein